MCVGGLRPVCRELHAGELETRPQRARQAEAEAFLAADQASDPMVEAATVSLTAGGVARIVELTHMRLAATLMRMRMAAVLERTRVLAELVRM
jgi:hypothetical protein